MSRRVSLSGVLLLTLIMVNLTRFADAHERHEGRCEWVCEIDDLNFGEELSNFKKQGRTIKADVQYKELDRVANPQINNSSNISTEVWITSRTANVFQSHGFVQFVNTTFMQVVLSGQLISWECRELAISCIKPRSRNLFLNYSTDLKDSACEWHQPPLLNGSARDSSDNVSLIFFFGYLWTDKNSRVFVGFVNSKHDKHSGKRNSNGWESYLIRTLFTLYYPAILALFCTTDILVPVRPSPQAEGTTENQENQKESSRDNLIRQHNSQDFTRENNNENFITDQEEGGMTVRLINISGLNPKGFRSLIANYVFSNTVNHSTCRKFVKLVLLVLFPVSIPFLSDLYFLKMPRIFLRIAPGLPSYFLTMSVIHFALEKCPYMLMFLFFYIIRCLCLCFTPTTTIWAPSFVCRKHLKCAICNNYCVQLIFMCFPRCNNFFLSACDECKRTSNCPKQCEVPENIKHNLQVQEQMLKKHWNYVYGQLLYWKQLVGTQKGFLSVVRQICFFPILLVLVGMYLLVVLVDFLFSSAILSLCYMRMWVTGEWLEHKPQLHYRIIRFLCHALEFLLICGSVAWVTYFSYCTSLAVEIAIRGVENSFFSNSVETFKYLTIDTSFLLCFRSFYKSVTGKYVDLTLKLFKSYKEAYKEHGDKLINYKQGGMFTIPKDVFDKACKKRPLNVKKIVCRVMWLSFFWLLFYVIFHQIEITAVVLTAVCGFIVWAYPIVIDFIQTKKTEDVVLEEVATNAVEDYIKDLIGR